MSIEKIKRELDPVRKKLRFAAWLNKSIIEHGGRLLPVLVGGSAVEIYTAGNYSTKDIDLVYDDSEILDEILFPIGFKKDGRYWYNDTLDIVLECPGSEMPRRTRTVSLDGGDEVFVISLEEIIVDRLCASKFWSSKKDAQWVAAMLETAGYVDFDFLRKVAAEEDVLDELDKIRGN